MEVLTPALRPAIVEVDRCETESEVEVNGEVSEEAEIVVVVLAEDEDDRLDVDVAESAVVCAVEDIVEVFV